MKKLTNNKSKLTSDYLRLQLSYSSYTGEFNWLVSNSSQCKVGEIAGSVDKTTGYRNISMTIDGQKYQFKAHRLAWFYCYGSWPKKYLDHIDRNKLNNRISNLREATQQENLRNYTKQPNKSSCYLGVCWHKVRKKWQAKILSNYKQKYLGIYDTEEEAALAYNKAALERDKDFKNLNQIV